MLGLFNKQSSGSFHQIVEGERLSVTQEFLLDGKPFTDVVNDWVFLFGDVLQKGDRP